jgi:beta-lactamase regulating signal transducer with metallopeptidase domain
VPAAGSLWAVDAGLVILLLKASLILGAAWGLQRLSARASAAVRCGIWAVSLLAVLLLPAAPGWLPPLTIDLPALPSRPAPPAAPVPAPATATPDLPRGPSGAASPQPSARTAGDAPSGMDEADGGAGWSIPWETLLLALWMAGVAIRLAWLAAQLARVRWLIGRSRPEPDRRRVRLAAALAASFGIGRRVRLLRSERVSMPLTWGAARPVVVLPDGLESWPVDRLRVVLLHELAHIRRWDYVTSLLAELACAVYWPVPLVWLARRRIHVEQEQACDDLVLQSGTESIEYAEHLLAIARAFSGNHWEFGAAITMARETGLKHRIRLILEKQTDRGPLLCGTGLVALTLLAAVAIPVAALRAEDESAAPPPAALVDTPPSVAAPIPAAPASAPTAAGPAYLWSEAELGDRIAQAQRHTSLSASSGAYLILSDEADRHGHARDAGEVSVSVRLPREGDYLVWARVAAASREDGSLGVAFDGGSPVRWEPEQGRGDAARRWKWRLVDETFHLGAGTHILRLASHRGSVGVDRLLVTSDAAYRPADRGAVAAGFRPEYRLLEAERANLRGPMQRALGDLASGGEYLSFGTGSGGGRGGIATFVFDVDQPGRYVIWGRVIAPDEDSNSFYASLDGGEEVVWDAPNRDPGRSARWWTWDPVSARDLHGRTVDPLVFDLQPGRHTLRLRRREAGSRLDAILVTNDLTHRPRGIWPATLPTAPVRLWLEAEAASATEPFAMGRDDSASGGRFLEVGKIERRRMEDGSGSAVLRFHVPRAGVYTLWARTIARDRDQDSFWLRVNGGPRTRWNEIPTGRRWRWSAVHDADRANQVAQFQLRAGENTIELQGREGGVRLDRFVITDDPLFDPSR